MTNSELSNHKIDKFVILYGAGTLGKMAKNYFNKLNIPFSFIMDINASQCETDQFWDGTKIIYPDKIPFWIKKSCLVVNCIVTSPYNEIKEYLNKLGFDNVIPFYDFTLLYQDKHPLNNGWITGLLYKEDSKNIRFILNKLNDDISRGHYLQFIAWHSLKEEWTFKDSPIIYKEKYFIPEIVSVLNDNETFVNIGAYDGEFTNKFIKNVNNKFNSIYAFEPDKKNINRFLDNTKEAMNNFNIHLIPKALGNITGKKRFYSGLDCLSQFSGLGQEEIEVYRLDDFKLSPTMIKIHTEGTEEDVFDGGIKTITKYRPIIMMTIYHNKNGLWKTPIKIIKSLNNYIYYFRLHAWCGTSGIFYAIPKERIK